MSWFLKDFTKEIELLRDQVGRFDNSRAKSLALSKSYNEKQNYLDKSRNELNKGNLSVKLSELIESDSLSKLELIKKSLKDDTEFVKIKGYRAYTGDDKNMIELRKYWELPLPAEEQERLDKLYEIFYYNICYHSR